MLSVYTFGDSMLDCGHYNVFGVNPGQLLVHNDDHLFPEAFMVARVARYG